MIKTLYTIGKILKENEDYKKYFDPWEDPFPGTRSEKGKILIVNVTKQKIEEELELEDFKTANVSKYLYREANAQAKNLVPTYYIYPNKDKDKYLEGIRKLFVKINGTIMALEKPFVELPTIGKSKKKTDIFIPEIDKLQKIIESYTFNYDYQYLLTFKIDGKYFGDFECYTDLFYEKAYTGYHKDSKAFNKLCSVSNEMSEEVWGRVNTLGFTVNDKPFSRNGFDGADSYKMFPVSPEAAKILEGARNIVDNEFSSSFYGLKYYLVPHFIGLKESEISEFMKYFIQALKKGKETETFDKILNSIFDKETIFNEIIEDENLNVACVYYDIFFYQTNQAQYLIKLHLQDVLPSRFVKILSAKKLLQDKYQCITRLIIPAKGKKTEQIIDLNLNFACIKEYFSKKIKNNTETLYHPYFFNILESVFYGTELNEENILKTFNEEISKSFKSQNEDKFKYIKQTKETFVIYQFFQKLNLFKNKPYMENSENEEKDTFLTMDGFIKSHPSFFNDDYKTGVFMLGCLTSRLTSMQYSKLKSEPFFKQLNGLRLDEKTITEIFPKLINKLRDYESAQPTLEAQIGTALVKPCKISKAEISYAFTLGLVMQKEFTKEYFKDKKAE